MHISICISTYKRPDLLKLLLTKLAHQETGDRFSYAIVVADNDELESARPVIDGLVANFPIPLAYCTEPRRNIAHVRNMSIARSNGDLIAFIDDDEFPNSDWLLRLLGCLERYGCAGVLGPVLPYYPAETPAWVKRGGFFVRPEHETGFVLPWAGCRTGNVLFRRSIIEQVHPVFNPEFGTAGSDMDFFRRMIALGHCFVWCKEAIVHEVVPPARWKRSFMLKRALLRGGNFLKHPEGRLTALAKSAVAIPVYTLLLPFLLLVGHHLFMKYLIKWCDHAARLLAVFGVKFVKERQM